MPDNLQVIKCSNCGKVLLEANGEVRKICPKCKTVMHCMTTPFGIVVIDENMPKDKFKIISSGKTYEFNLSTPK
jgi:NADH pyrophosphatase NudC (nudix superfamily)